MNTTTTYPPAVQKILDTWERADRISRSGPKGPERAAGLVTNLYQQLERKHGREQTRSWWQQATSSTREEEQA
jgi:hypothetical protein